MPTCTAFYSIDVSSRSARAATLSLSLPLSRLRRRGRRAKRASTTARYRGREFHDRAQRATYLPPLLGHDGGGGGTPLSLSSSRSPNDARASFSRDRDWPVYCRVTANASPSVAERRLAAEPAVSESLLLLPRCLRLASDEDDVASPPRLASSFFAS